MEKISLYIAGKKVDLDNNSFILFNYTMEDLSNPTIVKNSFSKQITLKGTPANNEIFGNLYRADRKTMFGDSYTGVAFDPLRKTPFTIYNEMNEILESGYVKIDSIEKTAGGYEYKVTLYGGLGSFFYGLTYDSDGNKRTLASLEYVHHNGEVKIIESFQVDKETLMDAWNCLEQGESYFLYNESAIWDLLNFAPCYNGIPEDFDADKVLMNRGFSQLVSSVEIDGETYTKKDGCSTELVKMAKKHSEWEMRCIMPFLQRPVISIKAIIQAIVHEGAENGYDIFLDTNFFSSNNPLYENGWITLPMIPANDRLKDTAISAVLAGTLPPADYLIGLAKMYGLVFLFDGNKRISILSRNSFYQNKMIDMDSRVDVNSIRISPMVASAKWYQLGSNVVGEYAQQYEQTYGKKYAVQRINTGYDFNSEIKELTKDIPFIEAADVAERSYLYSAYFVPIGFTFVETFPMPLYEEVYRQLFKNGDEDAAEDVKMSNFYQRGYLLGDDPYVDWLPKVQLHGEDNKPIDGANCVIYYNETRLVPRIDAVKKIWRYIMNDYDSDMESLNSGKLCWNLNIDTGIELTTFPSFRRMYLSGSKPYKVEADLSWGVPKERPLVDISEGLVRHTLYEDRWKKYLSDRYNVDSRVMQCKVNLSGFQVGQSLMRNFFFYDNAVWVINKIINHSITTDDLTECEFVKVKNIKNYTEGQKL